MIFDLFAPPQGPRGRGQKKCTVAHPIHVSNSHTKFGWISSNGLGGDSVTDGRTDRRTDRRTDGRTDGGDCNIPYAFLKKRGDNHSIQLENFRYQLLYYINSCLRVIPMLTIPASRNWKSCLGTLFPTIYDFGSMQISDTVLYK